MNELGVITASDQELLEWFPDGGIHQYFRVIVIDQVSDLYLLITPDRRRIWLPREMVKIDEKQV